MLDKGSAQLKNKSLQGGTYQDIRKMLESKELDAGVDRHAEPLAFAGGDLGDPGGQGCLRREARVAQRVGRPGNS